MHVLWNKMSRQGHVRSTCHMLHRPGKVTVTNLLWTALVVNPLQNTINTLLESHPRADAKGNVSSASLKTSKVTKSLQILHMQYFRVKYHSKGHIRPTCHMLCKPVKFTVANLLWTALAGVNPLQNTIHTLLKPHLRDDAEGVVSS